MSLKSTKPGALNFVLIAVLIALPTMFGLMGKPKEMTIVTVTCAIALAFANINSRF